MELPERDAKDETEEHGERRRHPRQAVSTPAHVEFIGYEVEGRLEDIGAGGVRFTTDDEHIRVEAGNFVFVKFDVVKDGESESLRRPVRVTRVDREQGETGEVRVFGMEFDDILSLSELTFPDQ